MKQTRIKRKELEKLLEQGLKNCSKCKKILPTTEFYKDSRNWHGLRGQCKTCAKKIANNYWSVNREYKREYDKKYIKENSHIRAAYEARRRAIIKQATPKWLTKIDYIEIKDFYYQAQEMTRLSGEKFEVDHIVPLKGENVCGLHVPWNLQVITKTENLKKFNKYHVETD